MAVNRRAAAIGPGLVPGRVSRLGCAPTQLATAAPRWPALPFRGRARWRPCQVGAPFDHQAEGLAGGARVFGFVLPPPRYTATVIMAQLPRSTSVNLECGICRATPAWQAAMIRHGCGRVH